MQDKVIGGELWGVVLPGNGVQRLLRRLGDRPGDVRRRVPGHALQLWRQREVRQSAGGGGEGSTGTAAGSEGTASTFAGENGVRRSRHESGRSSDDSPLADADRTLSANAVALPGGPGLKTRGRTAAVFGFELLSTSASLKVASLGAFALAFGSSAARSDLLLVLDDGQSFRHQFLVDPAEVCHFRLALMMDVHAALCRGQLNTRSCYRKRSQASSGLG